MKFIYARVSTEDQNVDQQVVELEKVHGPVDEVLTEKRSGKDTDNRPVLQRLIDKVRKGDSVIVYDISRLGRSVKDVLELEETFREKQVRLIISALGDLDITSSTGKMVVTTLAAVAEMQRTEMLEKQAIGIERAKEEGKYKGRSKDVRLRSEIKSELEAGNSVRKIAAKLNCSPSTVQRVRKDLGL
ncbi:recombinase family protein [Neptuniibacter sp. QD48_11]|uniref:recombinase family protein n=1 Tax=Neptuniibacter sp. QD48_11 TaxID=3398211 RepID=UPI0039F4D378